MTRRRVTLLASLFALFAMTLPSLVGASDAAVRKELETIYNQYVQAFKAKDAAPLRHWFERYLAPDMINQNIDGSRDTRQKLLDGVKETPPHWTPTSEGSGKIERLTVAGRKATVLFTYTMVRLIPASGTSPDSQEKPHKLVEVNSERDTWVKTPAGWKTTLSVNLGSKATLDGRPFPPPGGKTPSRPNAKGDETE